MYSKGFPEEWFSVDNGQLKITASNTCSIEKQVVAEPGMVYELVFDMDAETFSDVKVEVLESVASGKPVNTSYTTIRNGKHTIYFKAATNEIFLRFTPQTNLSGSRSAYINYITLRRVSSRPAPGSIVYTENMTLTSRSSNTPATYTASSSITFDSGFESGTSDEFQTFVEPTIFVSDGMERDDYRFGFNGQEKDDEVYGEGSSYDFGSRMYSARLGKWFSTDPYEVIYNKLSPYSSCGNNPIYFTDKGGNYLIAPDKRAQKVTLNAMKEVFGKNHGFSFNSTGQLTYSGSTHLPDKRKEYLLLLLLSEVINNSTQHIYYKLDGFAESAPPTIVQDYRVPYLWGYDLDVNKREIHVEGSTYRYKVVDGEETSTFKDVLTGHWVSTVFVGLEVNITPGVKANRSRLFWHGMGHSLVNMRYSRTSQQPQTPDTQRQTINFDNFVSKFMKMPIRDGLDHDVIGSGKEGDDPNNYYGKEADNYTAPGHRGSGMGSLYLDNNENGL
jgi:RHS repeat-associated protein